MNKKPQNTKVNVKLLAKTQNNQKGVLHLEEKNDVPIVQYMVLS